MRRILSSLVSKTSSATTKHLDPQEAGITFGIRPFSWSNAKTTTTHEIRSGESLTVASLDQKEQGNSGITYAIKHEDFRGVERELFAKTSNKSANFLTSDQFAALKILSLLGLRTPAEFAYSQNANHEFYLARKVACNEYDKEIVPAPSKRSGEHVLLKPNLRDLYLAEMAFRFLGLTDVVPGLGHNVFHVDYDKNPRHTPEGTTYHYAEEMAGTRMIIFDPAFCMNGIRIADWKFDPKDFFLNLQSTAIGVEVQKTDDDVAWKAWGEENLNRITNDPKMQQHALEAASKLTSFYQSNRDEIIRVIEHYSKYPESYIKQQDEIVAGLDDLTKQISQLQPPKYKAQEHPFRRVDGVITSQFFESTFEAISKHLKEIGEEEKAKTVLKVPAPDIHHISDATKRMMTGVVSNPSAKTHIHHQQKTL
jgi:hypothetical protein